MREICTSGSEKGAIGVIRSLYFNLNNNYIISEFDPSEACYIGILAGSSLERVLTSQKDIHTTEKLIQKPPQLRVVK
jgi:hypothetical protein